jgi:hypothetical protein
MSDQWTEEAVRSVLASLPPKSLAMLQALEDKAADWDAATARARQLAVLYGVDIQVAVKVDADMTEAMGRTLDHAVFHGAPKKTEPTPGEVHATLLGTNGAAPEPPTTRDEGGSLPEMPHSGEQPTPKDRRDAWLSLHDHLLADTERALRDARSFLPHANHPETQARWLAKEWAALQLLKALRDMKAPEVPVDHTVDQPTLEEAVEETPAPMANGHRWPCPGFHDGNHHPMRANLWACICTEAGR